MMSSEVDLNGVPLTMLWTLHNRASESKRADAILRDPDCERIYDSIAFDYHRHFGAPDGTHAVRSKRFDDVIRPWLAAHPGGTVIELAAGLETQFQRCDDGLVHWLCVDVPESIAVRARFLPASPRCRYLPISALDLTWLDEVDPARGVFVTAQGLFMYFRPEQVQQLCTAIIERMPGVELMFDTIPPWFSRKTMRGYRKTPHYQAPGMPWGIRASELPELVRGWSPRVSEVRITGFAPAHGILATTAPLFAALPVLRDIPPAIAHVRTAPDART
ncbi:class I SAM-dependent methyltransferase [Nocardia sp. NPDC127579]|uniref:class I SAM-dependent methyltransferase n=1 Tax=Nocardia sp. NPDC127579 TaxID=3345402 RepID=UPI003640ED47